jgi:hypothetical protein
MSAVVACAPVSGVVLKETHLVPQQAAQSATIRPGESTRADVRAALGVPWLESDFWRTDLYRADDESTGLVIVSPYLITPLPVGVYSYNPHRYDLVAYDSADRVAELSWGVAYDGALADLDEGLLVIRAGDLTLSIDLRRREPVLLADSSRLSGYLAARSRSEGCTLVVACLKDEDCPDKVSIDDGESFDTSAIAMACPTDGSCPRGFTRTSKFIPGLGSITEQLVGSEPVLHAISLPPGEHRLRTSIGLHDGRGEAAFECTAGQVVYGSVNSRPEGETSWWSGKAKLRSTATLSTVAPEGLDTRSLVLYRDSRWLVDH